MNSLFRDDWLIDSIYMATNLNKWPQEVNKIKTKWTQLQTLEKVVEIMEKVFYFLWIGTTTNCNYQ